MKDKYEDLEDEALHALFVALMSPILYGILSGIIGISFVYFLHVKSMILSGIMGGGSVCIGLIIGGFFANIQHKKKLKMLSVKLKELY